jgi:hypothetical protein
MIFLEEKYKKSFLRGVPARKHTHTYKRIRRIVRKKRKIFFGKDVGKNLGSFGGEIKPLRWYARATNTGVWAEGGWVSVASF